MIDMKKYVKFQDYPERKILTFSKNKKKKIIFSRDEFYDLLGFIHDKGYYSGIENLKKKITTLT